MAVMQQPTHQHPQLKTSANRDQPEFSLDTNACKTLECQSLENCSEAMPVLDHAHLLPAGPTNADGLFVWGHGEGCSIAQATAEQDRPFTEAEIACIMQQALSGLEFLHAKDICHKNLHLGNLHIDANSGSIKLSGYGVTSKTEPKEGTHSRGYTLFNAPEIRMGAQYTNSTDIWSVGGVALELLIRGTSREAENAAHRRPCLQDVAKGEQPIYPLGISLDCISFLDDCFQTDPSERLSAHELLEHPFIVAGCSDDFDPVESSLVGALDELLVISEENRVVKPVCRPAGLPALPSKGKLRFSVPSHTARECRSGNCSLCGASMFGMTAASSSIPIVIAQKTVKVAACGVEESGVRSPALSAASTKREAEDYGVRPEKPSKRMCNKWFSESEEVQLSMLGYAT